MDLENAKVKLEALLSHAIDREVEKVVRNLGPSINVITVAPYIRRFIVEQWARELNDSYRRSQDQG